MSCGCFLLCRRKVSKKKRRYVDEDFDIDLSYINDRLITMGFPSTGIEQMWRNPKSHLVSFLDTHHPDKYRVYNLCSESNRQYPASLFHGNVVCFPFPDHHPPNLSVFSDFVTDATEFLAQDPQHVVAVHCKAGKGRAGTMAVALMLHMAGPTASLKQTLRSYGRKRTKDGQGVTIPSQRRYLSYYLDTLRHGPRATRRLTLTGISLSGFPGSKAGPAWMQFRSGGSTSMVGPFDMRGEGELAGESLRPRGEGGRPIVLSDDVYVILSFHDPFSELLHLHLHTSYVPGSEDALEEYRFEARGSQLDLVFKKRKFRGARLVLTFVDAGEEEDVAVADELELDSYADSVWERDDHPDRKENRPKKSKGKKSKGPLTRSAASSVAAPVRYLDVDMRDEDESSSEGSVDLF
eukprot:gnl/Dysnectes_brevis/2513_a3009_754.p1 GENE.gnl/Dysnectes_brevis/2513_a3009_754~~gnl/Dysnectes_brevis/2513_a3009_754.p1  ORF type:complete len:407 (+),score=125.91 gnl/Dysnectes_brevis/2513_a3009_754:25-1245(+)